MPDSGAVESGGAVGTPPAISAQTGVKPAEQTKPNQPTKPAEAEAGDKPDAVGKEAEAKAEAVASAKENKELQELTEAVADISDDLEQISPDALRIGLSFIASGGDSPQAYIIRAQALREETNSAPTEGEGALTEKQRQDRIAFSYDVEIEGVRMKLAETKKPAEKKSLEDQLKKLQEERKKINSPNQLKNFVSIFAINEDFAKYIAGHLKDGGYPLAAVKGMLSEAVKNKDVRALLADRFKQLDISDEQLDGFEKQLDKMGTKEKWKKGAVVARNIGLGAMLMAVMMAYMSSKEKKQGMG